MVETREGELSGSLINEAAGLTVPITEAKVDGRQMTFTVVMTKPYPVHMGWNDRGRLHRRYRCGPRHEPIPV
ncbi:MAG TPA: hypothetical protein VF026_18045 [Ktedonobacteraceae bacterium]